MHPHELIPWAGAGMPEKSGLPPIPRQGAARAMGGAREAEQGFDEENLIACNCPVPPSFMQFSDWALPSPPFA